jgi:hypothetical protein
MSKRLIITLSDEQHRLLVALSGLLGLSMSELIRRAIDMVYRPTKRPRVAGFELLITLRKGIDEALAGRGAGIRARAMQFGSRRSPVVDPD